MKLSQKQKLLIAIVLFLITGYVLYRTFSSPNSQGSATDIAVDGQIILTDSNENQDIIDLANKFDSVVVNLNFFTSPVFVNLKDLTTLLAPESSGRPNPFSPIGNDSFSSKSISPITTATTSRSI